VSVSIFDLFKIGIGPSSSHTVGPMRAACTFAQRLEEKALLNTIARVRIELFGSLAHTGRGHGTDKAVMMGLGGALPDQIDPDEIAADLVTIRESGQIKLFGRHIISFDEKQDLIFNKKKSLPYHPNGMRFSAFSEQGELLHSRDYYSVGGGFVVNEDEASDDRIIQDVTPLRYPYANAEELLAQCKKHGLRIAEIVYRNEQAWREKEQIQSGVKTLWDAMQACIKRGCEAEGVLPGGLKVTRRAPAMLRELTRRPEQALKDPLSILDWVNLYALAVNEENAAGGRVVTAPTNGAAGIIPAVLSYYVNFVPGASDEGVFEFLLTAGAIGILYLNNASISGAEVGCQGEVGVACSMAAGGLTAAMGGSMDQVENAAEIGMEHNLGLTCDPIGGLVQIPCIERNAMASVKAINAQRMAARGDGVHFVSLDKVIKTMRETGADMQTKYKETSRGGLAVNVIEC